MLKLIFFVPETHCEQVKAAVFQAGAGQQGRYQSCAWQTLGQGQFMALDGSQPHIGEANNLTRLMEYRVEVLCPEDRISDIVFALRRAHPYEEPAYDIMQLLGY